MSLHPEYRDLLPFSSVFIPYAKNFVNNTAANVPFLFLITHTNFDNFFLSVKLLFHKNNKLLKISVIRLLDWKGWKSICAW